MDSRTIEAPGRGSIPGSVLHLIDTGGPGGAETVFLELASGLRDRGWRSTTVAPLEDWLSASLRERRFDPIVLGADRSFDLRYISSLRRVIREGRFDVIQTHLLGSSVYGALASLGTSARVVSTFHGVPDISPEDRLRRAKTRIISGRRHCTVLVSRFLQRHFRQSRIFDPPTARVIPNGIDCEIYSPGPTTVRAEFGIPADAPLVGAVGNMRPAKAYDVLLRAFAHVVQRRPEARLLIAGQGGNQIEERLLRLRGELGIEDSVTFAGFRGDVPALMRALDVYALSSSDEGFSLTTVQAMATGLPVVATRCGGPEEILADPGHGDLVENGDPEALAEALLALLEAPERRSAIGRRAREHVLSTYSMTAMVDSYAGLYASLLNGRFNPGAG